MKYNPYMHKRHTIRLKNYDYSKEGMYFITMCTQNREKLFGEIKNHSMLLNNFGDLVVTEFHDINNQFTNVVIDPYIVMPNHLHFILSINTQNQTKIGDVIRYFKGRTSSKIKQSHLWQRNYYDHIIRNEVEYLKIYNYIINNPYNWNEDSLFK